MHSIEGRPASAPFRYEPHARSSWCLCILLFQIVGKPRKIDLTFSYRGFQANLAWIRRKPARQLNSHAHIMDFKSILWMKYPQAVLGCQLKSFIECSRRGHRHQIIGDYENSSVPRNAAVRNYETL